jgi:hypothetical protein
MRYLSLNVIDFSALCLLLLKRIEFLGEASYINTVLLYVEGDEIVSYHIINMLDLTTKYLELYVRVFAEISGI